MSERFWSILDRVSNYLLIAAFFILVAFTTRIEIKDHDLWLHLKMGQVITQTGSVPDHDILSATISGKPWVNHEWLFQIIVFTDVHCLFGFDGLVMMQALLVVLVLSSLLLFYYNHRRVLLAIILLIPVLFVYQTRFTIRPDIFSILFTMIFLMALTAPRIGRWIYILIPIQIFWGNLHGYSFLGPLIVFIVLLGQLLQRLPDPANYRRLIKLFLLLVISGVINPLGIEGALYPLSVLSHLGNDAGVFFNQITELQKPIKLDEIFSDKMAVLKVLILFAAGSFIIARRNFNLVHLLLWLVFLVFGLLAVRNITYLAVASYIFIAINLMRRDVSAIFPLKFSYPKFERLTIILFKIALICWLIDSSSRVLLNGYFDYDTYTRKSEMEGVSKRNFPYRGVDFLVKHNIKGNFFNDFNSGAYLIGRTYPNIKVFIDGRTEVYGAKFFDDYQKIWREGDIKVFEKYQKKFNITGAFLNAAHQNIQPKVLKMFGNLPDWRIVYLDDDAVIFLKQTPAHQGIIDRYGIDIRKWQPKKLDLLVLGARRVDPYPLTDIAVILEALGYDTQAFNQLKEAMKVAPDDARNLELMGKIYRKHQKYQKAFEYFRLAVMYSPDEGRLRRHLGQIYEDLGDKNGAIKQYRKALELDPEDQQAKEKLEVLK